MKTNTRILQPLMTERLGKTNTICFGGLMTGNIGSQSNIAGLTVNVLMSDGNGQEGILLIIMADRMFPLSIIGIVKHIMSMKAYINGWHKAGNKQQAHKLLQDM